MAEDYQKLRIEIAGDWSTNDFAELFKEVETLHLLAQFGLSKIDGQTAMPFFFRWRPRPARSYEGYNWFDLEQEMQLEDAAIEMELQSYLRFFTGPSIPLRVVQINYASPGFTDLAGVGRVIAEVRKFIFGVTDRWVARKDRQLDREHKRQAILKDKLANAERFLKLADKSGIDPQTRNAIIRRALASDFYLETKVIEGKITEVSELE